MDNLIRVFGKKVGYFDAFPLLTKDGKLNKLLFRTEADLRRTFSYITNSITRHGAIRLETILENCDIPNTGVKCLDVSYTDEKCFTYNTNPDELYIEVKE